MLKPMQCINYDRLETALRRVQTGEISMDEYLIITEDEYFGREPEYREVDR
jgi:hypothetical protein